MRTNHLDLIAARMEQARWERGISVAELARRVGVDRKRLWRVLNGERAMRADEFVRLCAVLGIGLGSFFRVCKISGWKLVNLWLVAVESKSTHPTIFLTAGAAIIQPLI